MQPDRQIGLFLGGACEGRAKGQGPGDWSRLAAGSLWGEKKGCPSDASSSFPPGSRFSASPLPRLRRNRRAYGRWKTLTRSSSSASRGIATSSRGGRSFSRRVAGPVMARRRPLRGWSPNLPGRWRSRGRASCSRSSWRKGRDSPALASSAGIAKPMPSGSSATPARTRSSICWPTCSLEEGRALVRALGARSREGGQRVRRFAPSDCPPVQNWAGRTTNFRKATGPWSPCTTRGAAATSPSAPPRVGPVTSTSS